MSEPLRSAVPLASVGVILLGLVPVVGGPDNPLHWAMTAGMVGFGALLRARHSLRRAEGPLAQVPVPVARQVGRAYFITLGVIAVLATGIMATRWGLHFRVSPLSVSLPVVGLLWLGLIGLRVRRHGLPAPQVELPADDRPSRRPSNWDALSSSGSGASKAASSHIGL